MIVAWNYIADTRNRLLSLIHYRRELNGFCAVGNVAKVADPDYRPIPAGKPSGRSAGAFPQIDVVNGSASHEGFSNIETIGLQRGDPISLYQDFTAVVTHEASENDKNAQTDLEVIEAISAGGRQLAMPDDPASALLFVTNWGPITTLRQKRKAFKAIRQESRITVRVFMSILEAEFNLDI